MRWFLLPGMGATDAMYNGLKNKLGFKVNFLNWPEYRGENTYADVARRVIKENDIGADDVVGGSSLGGMVALEIAQLLNPKSTVLLGSAANRKEVQPMLSLLSPPLRTNRDLRFDINLLYPESVTLMHLVLSVQTSLGSYHTDDRKCAIVW